MTRKGTSVATLLTMLVLAACGRREEPAFFDAVPSKDERPTSVAAPLPASAMHVRWSSPPVPKQLTAGVLLPVTVTFTNTGDTTWPDRITADPKGRSGGHAVRLCYSLVPVGKHVAGSQHLGDRIDLMKPVAPGDSATLNVKVQVPDKPGDYILVFELLQELVVWFADLGADVLTIPVKVTAAVGAAPTHTPAVQPRN